MSSRVDKSLWLKLGRLRRIRRVRNTATLGLVVLGPLLALTTYLILGPLGEAGNTLGLRLILLADLVYILVVAALVLSQVARLIAARRAKSAGSRLHLRLTGVFALLALIPTVTVAIFAGLTINVGLEGWFSDRVRQVVGSSLAAAQAYEQEQRLDLAEDARALAQSINQARRAGVIISDSELLSEGQRQIQRGLREAYMIDGTAEIRARGDRSYLFDFEAPSAEQIEEALAGDVVVIEDLPNNEYRALVQLTAFVDRFLYVSRDVDGEILSLLDETQETVRLYQQLESERGRLLFEFGLLYLAFALILILAAIWLGLWFAERLSGPVGRLTGAAQQVGAGDLDVQVREENGNDEISM
ncbi:MAG: HAMP domain-containing protein, partial [Paracoccaceae bacterium]